MAIFKYKAISKDGKELSGVVVKADKYSAKKYLEERGLFIYNLASDRHFSKRINDRDLIEFFMHLLFQIKCNIPFHKSVESYVEIAKKKDFSAVVSNILNAISCGVSISIAFQSEAKYFGYVVVSILKAAELSGKLSEALENIIYFLKVKLSIKSKIKVAIFYPVVVFFVSIISCFICLHNLVPHARALYDEDLGKQNNIAADIFFFFVDNSNFIFSIFLLFLMFLILVVISAKFRTKFIVVFSRIPIFRKIKDRLFEWNFCSIFYVSLKSNLNIINIIDILHEVLMPIDRNIDLLSCKNEILNGVPLSYVMNSVGFISKQSLSIIEVGEQSNNLTNCFLYLSEDLSKKLESDLKSFSLKLGVFITAITGIILISIILCIVAPMYDNILSFGE